MQETIKCKANYLCHLFWRLTNIFEIELLYSLFHIIVYNRQSSSIDAFHCVMSGRSRCKGKKIAEKY